MIGLATRDSDPDYGTSPGGGLALRTKRGYAALRPTLGLTAIMLLLVTAGGGLTPGFLTTDNLRSVLLSAAVTGIVAVSMTPITMSGNFVSLASAQTAMLAAVSWGSLVVGGMHFAVAGGVVVIALAALGALEGLVVAAGLNTLITTLAVGAIIYGATSQRTAGADVTFTGDLPAWLSRGEFLGTPTAVFVFLAVTAAVTALVHCTVMGRWVILTGANPAAARISGVPVRRVTVAAFVVAGIGAAIAGMVASAQVGSANVEFLPTLTVDAIAAILIGGTSVAGGHGSPMRSAVGAIIIAVLNNLLSRHGLAVGPAQAVLGAAVLLVIVGLRVSEMRKS